MGSNSYGIIITNKLNLLLAAKPSRRSKVFHYSLRALGEVVKGSYNLVSNDSRWVNYVRVDSGLVKVTSFGNVLIIASMRVAYLDDSAYPASLRYRYRDGRT
jgi:hypothetical protein